MISILIPTYNYKVDTLIAMLHEQAGKISSNFEILVYDDGSNKYYDQNKAVEDLEHVIYKHFEVNRGRSQIRKELAENAKANWLLFLDADVLPTHSDFLKNYESELSNDWDAICGGIKYQDLAESSYELRYVYGKKREERDASKRQKEPYIIVTGNLMVRKSLFLNSIVDLENLYGEDLLLSHQFMLQQAKAKHINNPVWHLGLESSREYINKSEQALTNLVRWEAEGKISSNFTSLQKTYNKLRKWGMIPIFRWVVGILNWLFIKSNLVSKKPGLGWFDLYRLHYYAKLKRHA